MSVAAALLRIKNWAAILLRLSSESKLKEVAHTNAARVGRATDRPIRLRGSVPLLILVCATPGLANEYCVHDAAELTAALVEVSTAGSADGQDNVIRLAAGTYTTSLVPFKFRSSSAHAFSIEGGYDAPCAQFDPAPGLSVLDGGNATQVLNVESANVVTIRHVTIQNASLDGSAGAGAQVYLSEGGAELVFENNVVVDNETDYAAAGMTIFGDADEATTAYIRGNLFARNSAPSSAALSTGLGAGSTIQLTNNTIAANTNTKGGNPITSLGSGSAGGHIANNISYGNTNGYDYYLYSFETFEFDDNVVHQIVGATKPGGSGNADTNPQFADAAAGDFQLLSGSPAFAGGAAAAAPDLDLDGHVYPATGRVDLGAFEDTLFADGFQGG